MLFLFLGLSSADLIFYGFLLLIGMVVFVYIRIKRLFGTESDYLSDDSDTSDGDYFDMDSADW